MSTLPDFETANLSRLEKTIKLPMSHATWNAIGKAAKSADMGFQEFIMHCIRGEMQRLADADDEDRKPARGRRGNRSA